MSNGEAIAKAVATIAVLTGGTFVCIYADSCLGSLVIILGVSTIWGSSAFIERL